MLNKQILDILKIKNNKYSPLIINLFFFILLNNIIGLIPYSFTTTSQIIITLTFSTSILIGVTLIGIKTHKLKFFNVFIPSGIPTFILPLIFIIEIISYLSRVVSLSVRLSANMIAGHLILFIISTFSINFNILFKIVIFLPLLILLFFLEIGVCFIQAYVFIVLTSTYIKDINETH